MKTIIEIVFQSIVFKFLAIITLVIIVVGTSSYFTAFPNSTYSQLALFALLAITLAAVVDLIQQSKLNLQYRDLNQAIFNFSSAQYDTRLQLSANNKLCNLFKAFNSMAETVEANIKSIKDSEKLRKELVSNISHDLGGPITAITGFAETLKLKSATILEEDKQKYNDIILTNCDYLMRLVRQLSDLSELDELDQNFEKQALSATELFEKLKRRYQKVDRQFIFEIVPEDLIINADPFFLERALSNLIDNAIKFSSSGSRIFVSSKSMSDNKIKLIIKDEGQGIVLEDQNRIFERFYRSDKARSKSSFGSGLGLAIVKKIIDLHEATISFTSKTNEGSEFEVII